MSIGAFLSHMTGFAPNEAMAVIGEFLSHSDNKAPTAARRGQWDFSFRVKAEVIRLPENR
jgi:hypothetical protein